ncbi:hypothetical protein, partial [Heyndrickxia faecalis]|uniref:hypothetical protein n=1 Tax=Heyndrickxia faecalis TaxID=2824910 RepID=UPI003EFB3154
VSRDYAHYSSPKLEFNIKLKCTNFNQLVSTYFLPSFFLLLEVMPTTTRNLKKGFPKKAQSLVLHVKLC